MSRRNYGYVNTYTQPETQQIPVLPHSGKHYEQHLEQ